MLFIWFITWLDVDYLQSFLLYVVGPLQVLRLTAVREWWAEQGRMQSNLMAGSTSCELCRAACLRLGCWGYFSLRFQLTSELSGSNFLWGEAASNPKWCILFHMCRFQFVIKLEKKKEVRVAMNTWAVAIARLVRRREFIWSSFQTDQKKSSSPIKRFSTRFILAKAGCGYGTLC